ncbi:hypothetical protein SDC9_82134 [bioreactor metagenome]|uniref:Uncharacterized protein n=1 Tax=bioreactor metagenome TaxID=1076179 RepID=A0A644Z6A8_9ZZZZ
MPSTYLIGKYRRKTDGKNTPSALRIEQYIFFKSSELICLKVGNKTMLI